MKPTSDPPMPGGECTQLVDTGSQQVPPNASHVKLIPVGDGDAGPRLPHAETRHRRKPLLPGPNEIAQLPIRAQLAFASRCVRRLIPVLSTSREKLPDASAFALGQLTELIEQAAFGSAPAPLKSEIIDMIERLTSELAAVHGRTIIHRDVKPTDVHIFTRTATAEVTAILIDFGFSSSQLMAVRHDFDHIKSLSKAWTDETPVSSDVFGPL